mgnify:CR=1 FL=1
MSSLYLQPTTEQEIAETCASFRAGTAAGYDEITMNIVKESIGLITQPITQIVNLSLISGVVLNTMKLARVIPLFKSCDFSLFTNYRPVSVLPAFSKISERIVYKCLIDFFDKYNILSHNP